MGTTERVPVRALAGDTALALVLAVILVAASRRMSGLQPNARHVDALGYALLVGAALPLSVRRIWPLATLLLTTVATSAYLAIGYPYGPIFLSLVVAIYTAALRLPARRATLACALALVALLVHVFVLASGPQGTAAFFGFVPGSAWVVLPFAVGRLVRVGRESAARTRAELAQRTAYEERLRVAQEVHDVVGHGLTAINMQAEIALHVLPKRPEQAEAALTAISRTSKQALDELRAALAVVRHGRGESGCTSGAAGTRSPLPGLAGLDDLVARMSGTGVAVSVAVTGAPRDLPSTVDLAGYRIVQEALTNVLRHAGTATAAVRVEYQPDELTVEVTDTGRGPVGDPGDGHGIAGMRERVTALGGVLETGTRLGGGFRVYARLPVRA